jgi:phosphoglucosamine mutase
VQRAVRRHRADVGLSHDGDGDRVLMVDEKGDLVDGDQILAVCALDRFEGGRRGRKEIVGTVMSNYGLEVTLREAGIDLLRTPVGDRYVVEKMLRRGCLLGGEQSGHIVFLDFQALSPAWRRR